MAKQGHSPGCTGAALLLVCVASFAEPADAGDPLGWHWLGLTGACSGDCSVMVFSGPFVNTGLSDIAFHGDLSPFAWHYGASTFLGVTASRRIATFWHGRFDIEPEIGLGKRFGNMHEWEAWGAVFLRYNYFPWNNYIYTTVAISTGLDYASDISEIEVRRSGDNRGSRLLHYLAPEITFALPQHKSEELVVRLHHRSGAYGLVSRTGGGAQYLTVGLRLRF